MVEFFIFLLDILYRRGRLRNMSKFLLHSLQQIERTGQASFNETLRLMSDGFIEVEGGGYYRLTPAGEAELARLLLLDRAKKDKRNAAARSRSSALRGVGLKRTADGWA